MLSSGKTRKTRKTLPLAMYGSPLPFECYLKYFCSTGNRHNFTFNSFDTILAQFAHAHKFHKCKWQTVVFGFQEKVGQYCGIDYSTWEDLLCVFFFCSIVFLYCELCVCMCKCRARHEQLGKKPKFSVCLVDRAQVVSGNHWH